MGSSVNFDGIVSGMDTTSIIKQLMALERGQLETLEAKKTVKQERINIWKQVTANLLSIKLDAYALSRDTLYAGKSVSSSDSSVLDASVAGSPIDGTYTFTVNQLAQAHQLLSNGYDDEDTTPVGAGTITFEFGNGHVSPKTKLDFLNGQTGVNRGSFRITDRNGNSAVIDISAMTEVQEVINSINTNDSIDVTAALSTYGNGITITGNSGAGMIKVEEVNGGSTAADLGILETTGAVSVAGSSIYYVTESTRLNLLNDSNGVRTAEGSDMRILMRDNTSVDIDVSSATKLSDVIAAIENADADLDASLVDDGNGNYVLQVVDNSTDLGGTFGLSALNGSNALQDLGLDGTPTGNSLQGKRIIGGIDTVMIRNLRGGAGIDLSNDIELTLHDGITPPYVVEAAGFSGAVTIKEFIDLFNGDADAAGHFRAEINAAGNGIQIVDLTSGSAQFSIASNATTNGTTGLNIASAGTTASVINGGDLDLKYISENTLLNTLNSGGGAEKGQIKFTNKNGNSVVIDFSADYINTIGDVIDRINSEGAAFSISASVNDTGDGILITDSSGGSKNLIIDDFGGSFATDLNIKGNTAGATVDGAFEYVIDIAATDKLEDVRDKINNADINVRAAIINDGSVSGPYKLMLTSRNTGEAGQIVFDSSLSGGESLSMTTVAKAQNAVFTLGAQGIGSSPKVMYKSSNTITDVITGVSLQLKGTDSDPVTITLKNDYDSIKDSVQSFVETYNKFIDMVAENTFYDTETQDSGLLQGDYTINQIKNEIFSVLTESVSGLPSTMNNIAQVGLTFDLAGKLSLSEDTLLEALEHDLSGVKNLFTYSVNIASASYGTAAVSSGVTAPWTDAGAIDGNTSYEDYASGLTGWQAAGGTGAFFQLNFSASYTLQKFELYSIDTSAYPAASYALKSFDFQYWDIVNSTWQTAKSYSANKSGQMVYYFNTPITTNKVRVNNATGNDAQARITELKVFEARGIGKKLDELIATFTDSVDGTIALETEGINNEIDVIDEQIDVWEERLASKEEDYREKFTRLESMMQEFQSTSSWLSTQLSSINSGWVLRDGK